MPELKIETLRTDELIPYARNARTHTPEQVGQIAASIREFGFVNPVLIDGSNGIIAGHGRVMAAQKLGLATVPCIRLPHLTDIQRRAYILADNKIALNAGWDADMLALELADLHGEEFNLDLTGFNAGEIAELNLGGDAPGISDEYTRKVDAPIYEPKGEKPPIAELTTTTRADQLKAAIEAANIPDDIKTFLRTAASRHIVFDYGKIAEFYCHADKQTQELMEDSALIIIDFKKAMQLGYVNLRKGLAESLESEIEAESENDNG